MEHSALELITGGDIRGNVTVRPQERIRSRDLMNGQEVHRNDFEQTYNMYKGGMIQCCGGAGVLMVPMQSVVGSFVRLERPSTSQQSWASIAYNLFQDGMGTCQ